VPSNRGNNFPCKCSSFLSFDNSEPFSLTPSLGPLHGLGVNESPYNDDDVRDEAFSGMYTRWDGYRTVLVAGSVACVMQWSELMIIKVFAGWVDGWMIEKLGSFNGCSLFLYFTFFTLPLLLLLNDTHPRHWRS